MARGVVVVCFSRFGKPLQMHHKVVLNAGAKAIAKINGYDFGGRYNTEYDYCGPLFFVPDDTLLLDEASCLGIHSANDLYGGVVPYLFVKTAITHGLVDVVARDDCAQSGQALYRASAGDRIAGLHGIWQPRCGGGGQTHAYEWTDPSEEAAQCVGKRSDGDYNVE